MLLKDFIFIITRHKAKRFCVKRHHHLHRLRRSEANAKSRNEKLLKKNHLAAIIILATIAAR